MSTNTTRPKSNYSKLSLSRLSLATVLVTLLVLAHLAEAKGTRTSWGLIGDRNFPTIGAVDRAISDSRLSFLLPLIPNLAHEASFGFSAAPIPQASGSKIVFTSNRDGFMQIYVMNADGSEQVRLTYSGSNDDYPRWSPNGSRILFQSDRDNPVTGYTDIYVMNADGSGQTRLTSDPNDDSAAVWSADGGKIVFQSFRNGDRYQIYSMNANGSTQVNISNGSSNDIQPSWSPNGMKIAFASDRDNPGYSSIYVMNADGSGQTRLTFNSGQVIDEQPAWSRDGTKLAFVSTRDSILETWQETDDDGSVITKSKRHVNKEVYVMNADGSEQTRLTNDLNNDDTPYWSPDGTKVVFRSDRDRDCCDPTQQVWMMNPDGSSQISLSGNQFGDYSANWTGSGNQSPVANAGGSYNGMATQPVSLNGGASYDPDGNISSYSWSFGDGGTGSGVTPTHAYSAAGAYNITLTVTDNLGAQTSATASANISAANQGPVSNAGGSYSGKSGTSIQFNGSASFDPDGTIATYQWNFGDGANGTGAAPSHTYATAGTYTATLTVTDNGGATAATTTSAVITSPTNQPPIANLGGPYSAVSGTPLQFDGTGSSDPDGTITQYQWNFADGTASGASPTHIFAASGSHLVTLTVTDNEGATSWKSISVNVASPGGENLQYGSPDDANWDPSNRDSLDDPGNRRGNAPNTTTGNNNFQIVAPVLSLPGRGLDLNLNLVYNSLVWNKSANEILFDIDHDFPAPGWQLGFGKIVAMGTAGALLIEPDGTRHGFTGSVFDYHYGPPLNGNVRTFKGRTTDGSLIEYRCEMGTFPRGVARYPNGTVVYYANYSEDQSHPHNYAYPYLIVDANGNSIAIKYVEPWDQAEPRIERIIDSVGRVIAFHYDAAKRLTSITGPGLPDANGAATTQTFVRIHYKTQSLNLSGAFSGLTPRPANATFSAIDAIYYPATGKGYWFGGDSYSSYGMITKVAEERGMSFTAGANSNEQGTIFEGTVTRQQIYNYPSSPAGLNAAPSFTQLTETWDGGPVTAPTTLFSFVDNSGANERTITITNPDGTISIQKSFNFSNASSSDPNKFKDGLMKEQQTTTSAGNPISKTTFIWEKGTDDAPRLLRTETTDELGQVLATNYDQYGANNSVGRTRDYDYNGTTVIRTTRNTYLSYLDGDLDQGIDPTFGIKVIHPYRVNLVETVKLFTGDDSLNKLAAQTLFRHDEYAEPLKAYTPDYLNGYDLFAYGEPRQPNGITGILQHSAKFNPMPFNSENGGGSGSEYITRRGNVTSVVSYADTSNSSSPANPITETRTYDMAGSVIASSMACCEQTSSIFELATQYAFAVSQTRGAADPNSLVRVTTSATYDLNTGLPRSKTDANGGPTQITYYPDSLRPKDIVSPTGARISFEYDDVAMRVTQTTRLSLNGAIAGQTVKYLNGLGQVRREEALGANNVVDIVETLYDQFGRLLKQSRPYRNGETAYWKETFYDLASRVSELREPALQGAPPPPPPIARSDRPGEKPKRKDTGYDLAHRGSELPEPALQAPDSIPVAKASRASRRSHHPESNYLSRMASLPPDQGGDAGSQPVTKYFYNEATRPAGASSEPGQTTRIVDPWGRWRWMRLNSSGKLAEVVEPNPVDVNASGYATKYSYDALNNLVKVEQGDQVRRFRHDSLGRLTQQKLAEASATLNSAGEKVTEAEMWSDVFVYDQRSNIVSHTDARGVKTIFSYQDSSGHDDPLNRLQSISYDTSRVDSSLTVLPAPTVTYQYRTKPSSSSLIDVTQVEHVFANGVSTEDFVYDTEGRLQDKRFTFSGRSQPMTISYDYDNLSRVSQTTYPEQYQPSGSATRKAVTPSYDVSSRMSGLQVNGVNYVSQINYNAASQITSLAVGTGANQLNESYSYEPGSSLLETQTLQRGATTLMSLRYEYRQSYCEGPGLCIALPASYAYTGQVTRVMNPATGQGKLQHFSYDSLGRLKKADQGNWGEPPGSWGMLEFLTDWDQTYSYDRYGNRTGVAASNNSGVSPVPQDGAPSLSYDQATNRITSPGFSYDPAGNQTTTGAGQSFVYDAAGRLAKVKDQNGSTLATYTYGASNQRLITQTGNESSTAKTYYVWEDDSVITEYTDPSGAVMPQWSKNYIYFGARLLATEEPNGVGGEIVRYHHPDRLGTRLVTNNTDTTYFQQVGLPFGTALDAESSGATNRRFTSYDRSSTTGLDYAVNRQYDSRQGRFTQPDPLGMGAASLADPQSLNMYSYVGNDPVNRLDPDGQFWGALFRFIGGLFRGLRPNVINGSFAYGNHPAVSVSFTTNFQNIGVGYGEYGIPLRVGGHWLPELLSPKNDAFGDALAAARGILSGDNDCSRFFGGVGLNALNGIADAVNAAGDKAYQVLDNVNIGISMNIPTVLPRSRAPILTSGIYAYVPPNSVAINSRGAFGMQASFGTLPRFGGYSPGSLQARVLQLLHETGHLVVTDVFRTIYVSGKGKKARIFRDMYRLTFLLPLDGGNTDLSEKNTDRVLKACRKEIDKLEN